MRTVLSRCGLITFATLVSVADPSSATGHETRHQRASVRFLTVPGLSGAECGSTSSAATKKCDAVQWKVQVFRVLDDDGVEVGCLASFGYNDLNIRTTKDMEGTTVTWYLDKNASAKFVDTGIDIQQGSTGHAPSSLFQTPVIATDGLSVSVEIKKKITGRKKFNHLPVVQVSDITGAPKCLGVDPTIGNSAN